MGFQLSLSGIAHCFSDINPTTFIQVQFPEPSVNELQNALVRAGNATADVNKALTQIGMKHHVMSMRWWGIINPKNEELSISRELLHTVALVLDLQAALVGRWLALGS